MEDNEKLSEETTKVDNVEAPKTAESTNNNGASENSDTSKNKENVNEVEFTDSTPSQEEVKAKQDNSENARRRRAEERQAELKRARYDAIKETIDGVNPFTNKPIEDDIDIEEYLAMKEIKKQGKDPLTDYSQHMKDKQKAEEEINKEKAKKEEWLQNDYNAFKTKHPDVDLKKLISDKSFELYAKDLVGEKPLSEIYESYMDIVSQYQKEQQNAEARNLANAKASPGSLTGSETDNSFDFFTVEQVKKMSQEEVHKNFDIIMASMKKWK